MINRDVYDTIKKLVSDNRWTHTLGVVAEAKKLAKCYGISEDQAETAAFFHDFCRNFPVDILNGFIKQIGLEDYYLNNVALSHGKVAAALMLRDYHIQNQDILNAVAYHTTGRADMSVLEKVIFVADAIEPGRDYNGVEHMRRLATIDLEGTCIFGLEKSLEFVRAKGSFIHPDTISALNYLTKARG